MTLVTAEIAKFLKRVRLCFVATASKDARPNVSPKGTLIALDSKLLAFADIRSPDTRANILENSRIEVSVIDPVLRRGYLFAGTARIVTSGAEFDKAVSAYKEMGVKSKFDTVIVIEPERISHVSSPIYDMGATEDEVRKTWTRRYLEG